MLYKNSKICFAAVVSALMTIVLLPVASQAHCDGLDGPVVTAARKALETGDINPVLPWIQKADEPEIKAAFKRTLSVRRLDPAARELADTWFFETLVRIHRAGEGAPYTGLKPAGRDLGPAIPAGDRAIESQSVEALLKVLTNTIREGLHARFHPVVERVDYAQDNIDAGREYVKSYVEYIHYVEGIYAAAKGPAGHTEDSGPTGHAH